MEIHKPKPIHNLRDLAKEIGVIVVGILIALGLEQAVEAYRTSERTELSRRAIDAEVRFNLAKANRELDMRDCMARQLAALSDAIGAQDQARVRRLLAASQVVRSFPWTDVAWRTAVASDAADHFGGALRRKYSLMYGTVIASGAAQEQYLDAFDRLRSIALSGLANSPDASATELSEMARFSAAQEHLLDAARIIRLNAKTLFGFESSKAEMDSLPGGQGELEQCQAAAAAAVPAPQA